MNNKELAQVFKALGDENRLKMVQMIAAADDICACHLLDKFDFSQPTLSHHIKILCAAGLIECRKEGKWMHYSLNPACVEHILDVFGEVLKKAGDDYEDQPGNRCSQ